MQKNFFIGLVGALVLLVGFYVYQFAYQQESSPLPDPEDPDAGEVIRSVELAGECVDVDVAQEPSERAQGLSGRTELLDGTGMLFVFEQPDRHSFWMKEMNFSIDMLWFSEDKRVVHIVKNASPESFPESFRPDEPALYVLEVPAGFSQEQGVEAGDSMGFQAQACG
ncbi:MAG: DUF192 domain-containing protein [Candidatus Paceibacterota bacterium]